MFGSMSCKAHQAHIALSEPMTSVVQQGSSLGSCPTSPTFNPHYSRLLGHWPCVKSCETEKLNDLESGLSPKARKDLFPLLGAWGLRPLHQSQLPNLESASLPSAEAENVKSNQSQPRTQHSQPDQSQLLYLIQTALLRANFSRSFEITFGLLTADTMRRRRNNQHQLQTSPSLTQQSFLHNQSASTNCRPAPA